MSEQTKNLLGGNYNPDVLECLANLSNDEVFTPPKVVNNMLDMLPEETWSNPNLKFLDPACKTGVFLREIAKRLIVGLADEIPDLQERLDHIFKEQLYGIAITELTALASRRSLYCSKYANGKYAVSKFDNPDGNIRFVPVNHAWEGDRCKYCGASRAQYQRDDGLESHAYEFIHTNNPEEIFNMKFDVIIGNPPYQMSDGGGGGSAMPLYNRFVINAKKMTPDILSMIIPSRWFTGGRGLDDFRSDMLNDRHICSLVDYPISTECFSGVEIKGGICYFLRKRDYSGDCEITTIRNDRKTTMKRPLLEEGNDNFIRYNDAISIWHKVAARKEPSFADLVSTQRPFGFRTYVTGDKNPGDDSVKIYANKHVGFVDRKSVTVNKSWLPKYKVYISAAYGAGEDFPHQILGKPILGEPNTCCSETYLVIGPFETEEEARNVKTYIQTRFFRMMVLLQKSTQHTSKKVYSYVPIQDFTQEWDDEKLYNKYQITDGEKEFIESMIKPMGDK